MKLLLHCVTAVGDTGIYTWNPQLWLLSFAASVNILSMSSCHMVPKEGLARGGVEYSKYTEVNKIHAK